MPDVYCSLEIPIFFLSSSCCFLDSENGEDPGEELHAVKRMDAQSLKLPNKAKAMPIQPRVCVVHVRRLRSIDGYASVLLNVKPCNNMIN
jgi:hypothetical protein